VSLKKKILIIDGEEGTAPYFSLRTLGASFEDSGYPVMCIKPDEIENYFQNNSGSDILFALTHNHRGAAIKLKGSFFYDHFNFFLFSIIDTPLNKFNQIKNSGRNIIIMVADIAFSPLIREVVPDGVKIEGWYSYFNCKSDIRPKPFESREIDILFPARIEKSLNWLENLSFFERKLIRNLVEESFRSNDVQIHEILNDKINQSFFAGLFLKKRRQNTEENWKLLWNITHLIRTTRRKLIIEELRLLAIKDPSLKIVIITDKVAGSWIADQAPGIEMHEFMPWDKVLELMSGSKAVINVMPFHVHNTHERIATAQAMGAAVFSDRNTYLSTRYKHKEDMVFYGYEKGSLGGLLYHFLRNDVSTLKNIAEFGKVNMNENDLPSHRTNYILGLNNRYNLTKE
jgi:hypothetical protein